LWFGFLDRSPFTGLLFVNEQFVTASVPPSTFFLEGLSLGCLAVSGFTLLATE
jgi:hypothetical protein